MVISRSNTSLPPSLGNKGQKWPPTGVAAHCTGCCGEGRWLTVPALPQHIVTSAQNEEGQPCAVCFGPRLVPLWMTALLLIPSYYIDVWGISVAGTQGPP